MVKKRKLFERLLSSPQNIRFDELMTLLGSFGFELDRVRGSHHVWVHPQIGVLLSIQPDNNGKAKPYQIRQFLKIIEQYDLRLMED